MHEPKFRIFYDTPDYELTTVGKEAKYAMYNSDEPIEKIPWPEVDFLFGEDVHYLDTVSEIMRIVTTTLSNTITFSKVKYLNDL